MVAQATTKQAAGMIQSLDTVFKVIAVDLRLVASPAMVRVKPKQLVNQRSKYLALNLSLLL